MSTQMKAEILELGETLVTLLKSPICPPEVRVAIIGHLDQVRQQLDMTNPDLVRSVFSFLAETATLPASPAKTQAQGQAIAAVLTAVAAPTASDLPANALPTPAKVEEPLTATAAATTRQNAAQPAPVVASVQAPEPVKMTNGNLASRLAISTEEREDVLS